MRQPYDRHTLYETPQQLAILTEHQPKAVFVDLGYRGTQVYHHKLKRDITGRNDFFKNKLIQINKY